MRTKDQRQQAIDFQEAIGVVIDQYLGEGLDMAAMVKVLQSETEVLEEESQAVDKEELRKQIFWGSPCDEYSPTVKRVMAKFWAALDKRERWNCEKCDGVVLMSEKPKFCPHCRGQWL